MNNTKYAVQMLNITKTFLNGKIVANKDLTLEVFTNEIHALIGENGAGKSTLMSILFGLYEQDSGEVLINGQKVHFKSAVDAHKLGIGMVHQHFKLVDNYTVLQNIILGCEPLYQFKSIKKNSDFINFKEAKNKLTSLINKYNFDVDLNDKISNLTVGQQQKVEILKLLYLNSDILIFDEPTAVLSDTEIESFLQMLLDFKSEGKTVIIITHKLHEVKKVADSATVIRLGRFISRFDVKDYSIEKMAELMVGRSLKPVINNSDKESNGEIILSVKKLPLALLNNSNVKVPRYKWLSNFYERIQFSSKVNKVKNFFYKIYKSMKLDKLFFWKEPPKLDFSLPTINFKIRAGEIVAIAGIEGNGQSELVKYISGNKKAPIGTILFKRNKEYDGWLKRIIKKYKHKKMYNLSKRNDISFYSIENRLKGGISLVPEDRHKDGLFLDDSISYNTACNWMYSKEFNFYGFINKNAINNHALRIIDEFDVRGVGALDDPVRGLSGGNQQKLIIGREIFKGTEFIIFYQPTRGLDIGAIEYIHSRILQAKNEGKAVLLVSYELDEILSLADRILVMSKNMIIDQGTRKEMTRNRIGLAMAHNARKEEANV